MSLIEEHSKQTKETVTGAEINALFDDAYEIVEGAVENEHIVDDAGIPLSAVDLAFDYAVMGQMSFRHLDPSTGNYMVIFEFLGEIATIDRVSFFAIESFPSGFRNLHLGVRRSGRLTTARVITIPASQAGALSFNSDPISFTEVTIRRGDAVLIEHPHAAANSKRFWLSPHLKSAVI